MPKWIFSVLFLLVLTIYLAFPSGILAQSPACTLSYNPDPGTIQATNTKLSVTFQSSTLAAGPYFARMQSPHEIGGGANIISTSGDGSSFDSVGNITFTFQPASWDPGQYAFYLIDPKVTNSDISKAACSGGFNLVEKAAQSSCSLSIPTTPIDPSTNVGVQVSGMSSSDNNHYEIWVDSKPIPGGNFFTPSSGPNPFSIGSWPNGTHLVELRNQCNQLFGATFACRNQLQCGPVGFQVVPRGTQGGGQINNSTSVSFPMGSPASAGIPCYYGFIPGNRSVSPNGTQTAIGCVPTDTAAFVQQFLKWALGGAGGIALLIMAIGSIQMIAAAGNQDAVKAGRDRFTSALVGLLFIIFAVFLLQVIGVDILNIPGFHR